MCVCERELEKGNSQWSVEAKAKRWGRAESWEDDAMFSLSVSHRHTRCCVVWDSSMEHKVMEDLTFTITKNLESAFHGHYLVILNDSSFWLPNFYNKNSVYATPFKVIVHVVRANFVDLRKFQWLTTVRKEPFYPIQPRTRLVYVFKNWKLLFKNIFRNTYRWKSVWKYVKCC